MLIHNKTYNNFELEEKKTRLANKYGISFEQLNKCIQALKECDTQKEFTYEEIARFIVEWESTRNYVIKGLKMKGKKKIC